MERAAVVGRGNGDGRDPELAAGAEDAHGDLAAVRHQELPDRHRCGSYCGRDTLARSMRRLLVLLAFVLLCLPAQAERRHGLPDRRPRLGARRRDEPVRRARLRRGRLGLPADPRRTTTAARRCRSSRPGPCACCSPRAGGRDQIGSSKPFKVVDARGKVRKLKPGTQNVVAAKLAQLRSPLRFVAGRRAAPARTPTPTAARCSSTGAAAGSRSSTGSRSTATSAASCPWEMPDDWHPRGAARAGRGRALVRARDAEAGHALRPLRRHAQPGLRRHPGRGGLDEPGDRVDRGQGRLLEGPRRDDLLPLDLGRPDGLDRGSVAEGGAGAVPRLGRRPVRHALEASTAGGRSC